MKTVFVVTTGEGHGRSWIVAVAETKSGAKNAAHSYMNKSGKEWLTMHPDGTVFLAGINFLRIEEHEVVDESVEENRLHTT